jgi:hypothetical protein
MTIKTKQLIRKAIYAVIFIAMLAAFIMFGNKYAGNSEIKVLTINDYYKNISVDNFEVISGTKFIKKIQDGKHIVVIGSSKSVYSQRYIEEVNKIVEEFKLKDVYYYDIINDKAQGNSNYYKIVELLDGYLITTDTSVNNLLSPSLYIIDNGKVKYYNVETSAMKNTDKVEDYWTLQKELNFKEEVTGAINKYYLNK